MPTKVNVEGFGVVNFPDEMSQDDIKSALNKKFGTKGVSTGEMQGPQPVTMEPQEGELIREKIKGIPTLNIGVPGFGRGFSAGTKPTFEGVKEEVFRPYVPIPKFDVGKAPALGGSLQRPQWEQQIFNQVPFLGALYRVSPAAAQSMVNQVIGGAEFLESPGGIAAAAAGRFAPKTVETLFAADMLHGLFKQAGVTSQQWGKMSPSQRIDSLITMGSQAALAGLTGFHALKGASEAVLRWPGKETDASKVSQATEVHGDVRTQPTPASTVSEQEGEPRVQPQTGGGLAEETQIPLEATAEYQGYKYEKRGGRWYPIASEIPLPQGSSEASASERDRNSARFISELEKVSKPEEKVTGSTEIGPAEDILISEEDASIPRDKAVPMLMNVFRVTERQADNMYTRARREYKLDEPQQELGLGMKPPPVPKPKPPPVPGAKPKPEGSQGELGLPGEPTKAKPAGPQPGQPTITKNPTGTYEVQWIEHGVGKKHRVKTEAEANALAAEKATVAPGTVDPEVNYLSQKSKSQDTGVQMETSAPGDVDAPFIRGQWVYARNGVIHIYEPGFREWLKKFGPDWKKAIDKLVEEESIHAHTLDAEAKKFYDNMTAAERWLANFRYSGEFTREKSELTDTQIGHESIRAAIQRLRGVPISEVEVLFGGDAFMSHMASLLEGWIYNARVGLGTKASAWQKQYLRDLDLRLKLLSGQADPNAPRGTMMRYGSVSTLVDHMSKLSPEDAEVAARRVLEALPANTRGNVEEFVSFFARDPGRMAIYLRPRLMASREATEAGWKALHDLGITTPLSPPPSLPGRQLREAKDRDDLSRKSTNWAYDAGMAMRSVDDLRDASEVYDRVRADYEELKKEPVIKEGESLESQMDRLTRRLRIAHEGQMIREAIEAATNTGSAAAHDLGERPLDYHTNPEVKNWLDGNAQKLGITTMGEPPFLPERKKLKRPSLMKVSDLDRDLAEKLGSLSTSGKIGDKDFLTSESPYHVAVQLASMPISDWPLNSKDKAALIEWFKKNEDAGYSRASLMAERANHLDHIAKGYDRDIANRDRVIDAVRKSGNTGLMWLLNSNQQHDMAKMQQVLDASQKIRQQLKELTGEFYPEIEGPEGIDLNIDLDEPPPSLPERRKPKVKQPVEFHFLSMDRDVTKAVNAVWDKFGEMPEFLPNMLAVADTRPAAAALAIIPPSKWPATPEQRETILNWFKKNGDDMSLLAVQVLNAKSLRSDANGLIGQLQNAKSYLADLVAEGKDPDLQRTVQQSVDALQRASDLRLKMYRDLADEIAKTTGMPVGILPEVEGPEEGLSQSFPALPERGKRRKSSLGEAYPRAQGLFQYIPDVPEVERPREMKAGEAMHGLVGEGMARLKQVRNAELKNKLPVLPPGIEVNEGDVLGITQSYLNSKIEPPSKVGGPFDRPSFSILAEWARRRLNIHPETIRPMWEDNVWAHLIRATGARLEEWVHALKLEGRLAKYVPGGGTPRLRNIASIFEEAQLAEEAQAKLRQEQFDKLARMEKKAQKLETEGKSLKSRAASGGTKQVEKGQMELVPQASAEYEWRSKFAEAKQIREQIDELSRLLREGATLTEKEKGKVTGPETQDILGGYSRRAGRFSTQATPAPKPESEAAEAVKGRTPQQQAAIKAKQFRDKAISEIARKLIAEAEPTSSILHKKSIELEDIDFTNVAAASEDPWHEISSDERANPRSLQSIFKSGSRRRSDDEVTVTKRLAVIRERDTGKVFMVSAYPEGRAGVKLMHPYGAQHTDLKNILKEYDPLISILLKEPVKDFKWAFDDLADFNDKFGTAAHEEWGYARYAQFAGEPMELPPEKTPEIEGTEGIEAAGVAGAGPGREEAAAAAGEGRGVTEKIKHSPLTGSEVGSIVDYLDQEIGREPSREEFGIAIDNLKERLKELAQAPRVMKRRKGALTGEALERRSRWRPLQGMHRNVWAALVKIAHYIYREADRKNEFMSLKMAYEKAIESVYSTFIKEQGRTPYGEEATAPEDKASFVQSVLGQFTRRASETGGTPVSPLGYQLKRFMEPRAVSGQRELTMPRFARKSVPAGEIEPAPTGAPEKSKMLSPEERAYVESEAARKQPYKPTSEYLGESGRAQFLTPQELDAYNEQFVNQHAEDTSAADPTKQPPEIPDVPEAEEPPPFMFQRTKYKAAATYDNVTRGIRAGFLRLGTKDIIAAGRDTVSNMAALESRADGNSVRVWSKDPKVRLAAIAAISSRGDLAKAGSFLRMCDLAITQAQRTLAGPTALHEHLQAVERLRAAKRLKEGVQFYLDDPGNPAIWNTAVAAQRALKEAYTRETAHGINLQWEPEYVPGRYEAEFFNDDVVMFWEQEILGLNFRKPKMFNNYFEAIAAGNYIPRSFDIADLVEHRVRQGYGAINMDLYIRSLRDLIDKPTGEPVALDALRQRIWMPANPRLGTPGHWRLGKYISPGPEYRAVNLGINKVPIYVRRGYKPLVDALVLDTGGISESPVGKFGLQLTGALKHSVILMFDTFHPIRLGQMAFASMGGAQWKGAWSALEYRQADLAQAVRQGLISQKHADWANAPVVLNSPTTADIVTRRDILEMAVQSGLNVGKLQDALYRAWIENVPVLGKFNRMVFDKFTRGLMAQNAVKAFEAANAKNRTLSPEMLMRDVVKDINIYFGSLGRQGVIKNPTLREISQLVFLAPQWVEGLIQKEVRTASRLSGATALMGKFGAGRPGMPYLGTLGKAVGRGLLGYLALTQAINLIFRRKFTWQNEEEGHKMDAFIPMPWEGKNRGLWLSPLSVFAEVTHDILRLYESRPTVWHALRQIGENKLGPWGRLMLTGATLEGPRGEKPQTTAGIAKIAGQAVAPVPITFGKFGKWALGGGRAPLELERQGVASFLGVKTEPNLTANQEVSRKARQWMKKNNYDYRPYTMNPTEEASYEKIRLALRDNDIGSAKKLMERMRVYKNDKQILDGMRRWAKSPFTGRTKFERWFMTTLNPHEIGLYSSAVAERYADLEKFIQFYMSQEAK